MSEYIIKNEILIGKTKDEIIELLGDDFYEGGNERISYYLGLAQGLGIDPDILIIHFENGIVIKVYQKTT
jgi:hypothetical protein